MPSREELLSALGREFRIQATRTVLMHSAIAGHAGLNLTDLQCLNLLGIDGPMTPGQLARHAGLTRGGAVTTVIDRLQAAGFVRRTRDPGDRRRVLVELQPEVVMARVASLFETFTAAWTAHLAEYDEEQLALVLDFTTRGNQVMHAATLDLQRQRHQVEDSDTGGDSNAR